MSDTPKDDLATELEDRAYTAIAYIIRQLATSYVAKVGDTLTVNDSLLKTMSIMVGEMIACYPEDEQDDTHDRVRRTIDYSLAMMVDELSSQREESDTPIQTTKEDAPKYDLARMKPQGNC